MPKSAVVFLLLIILLCFGGAASLTSGSVLAQGDAQCPVLTPDAIERLQTQCGALPAGSVCAGVDGVAWYAGDNRVQASLVGISPLEAGMTVTVDIADAMPGVAVLRVPALNDESQPISVVLIGRAELLDAPTPPRAPVCNARSLGSINVRTEPSTDAAILGQLAPEQLVPIEARLADSTWWRIPWQDRSAWVFAELTPADCDPASMLVFDIATGDISGGAPTPPYQAATLYSDGVLAVCPNSLPGGALLQSPEGGAEWLLNEMLFQLDGSVWVDAPVNDVMAVQVLEGQVIVEAGGVSRLAQAGQMLRIPVRDGFVDGVPGPARDGVAQVLQDAPVGLLPRQITMPQVTVALPDGQAEVICSVFTQQVVSIPDAAGRAGFDLIVDRDQTVRLSAAGTGVVGLTVEGNVSIQQEGDRDSVILAGAELLTGRYRIEAEADGPVTFGVTCDLPVVTNVQTELACEDLLLGWEGVQGGEVRFTAPAGAQVSAVVEHPLPSEGPASMLSIYSDADERQAQTPFASVGGVRVAGPLRLAVPAAGTYRVVWDGDPFNMAAVEVICEPPIPAIAEEN